MLFYHKRGGAAFSTAYLTLQKHQQPENILTHTLNTLTSGNVALGVNIFYLQIIYTSYLLL